MKKLGLYIHIPFCARKCDYCDFYSVANTKCASRFTDALLLQLEDYGKLADKYEVDTIFIGGGTPTLLPEKDMLQLINGIYRNFKVLKNAEFTMEANPATVSVGMLKKYRKAGVNRLSFGVQSAVNKELEGLTRIHSFEDVCKSFYLARRAGFENINIDLMYGIPHQTETSLRYTISKIVELNPEHISLYGLKIEDSTPFAKRKDMLNLPDEDTEFAMYNTAIKQLAAAGYYQYEISNFCKKNKECRHNLRYWLCGEYLGFGPSAHSYFRHRRFSFKKDLDLFMNSLEYAETVNDVIDEDYEISPLERVDEYIMLRLRLKRGLDTEDFKKRFGKDFEEMYGKELKLYVNGGFMTHEGTRYAFTPKGMYVSNYILSTFLTFESDIASNIANGSDK